MYRLQSTEMCVFLLVTFLKVGHTGIYDAAVEAVTATDKAVGTIYDAAYKHGYVLLITADHGNAEQMKDPETGNPHTAHTTNVVPFYMVGVGESKGFKFKENNVEEAGTVNESEEEDPPALCDVAPTILDIMVRIRFPQSYLSQLKSLSFRVYPSQSR
jgi:2,3-bisphosphoglycerate-independent phosphoglycerate mutase